MQPVGVVAIFLLHCRDLVADGRVDCTNDIPCGLTVSPVRLPIIQIEAARFFWVCRAPDGSHLGIVEDVYLRVRRILEDLLVGILQRSREDVGDAAHRRRVDRGGSVAKRKDTGRCEVLEADVISSDRDRHHLGVGRQCVDLRLLVVRGVRVDDLVRRRARACHEGRRPEVE